MKVPRRHQAAENAEAEGAGQEEDAALPKLHVRIVSFSSAEDTPDLMRGKGEIRVGGPKNRPSDIHGVMTIERWTNPATLLRPYAPATAEANLAEVANL